MNYKLVKLGNEFTFVNLDEIDCIKSEGKYLRMYRGDNSYLIRQTLNSMESNLDSKRFVRISRSAIVNIERIRKIERTEAYAYTIRLNNDRTLMWSRNYRKKLLDVIQA
jgi:two-component system LytT family response regulator